MADEKVIFHKAFGKVADSAYVDTEDLSQVPISTLDECRNLTPFSKLGSLKQVPGFSSVKTVSDLPNETNYALTGYKPVDMYIFGLDKDQKEIYLLVYKNSSNLTRFFISPFYNPGTEFSNYNPKYTPETWQTGWMELTEKYTVDVQVTGANTVTFTTGANPIVNTDNWLSGMFIVNIEQSTAFVDRADKYNYITNHSYSAGTHTLTLKGNITGWGGENWTNGDTCVIVRFPVTYFYKGQPNTLANINGDFDGLPTDFIYRDGQLRIPCGKSNKPLILDFIKNRRYFLGNGNAMSYEGFWFDFQSLPQRQKHSATTAWQSRCTSAAGTSFDIAVNGSNQVYWTTAANGKVTINPVSGNFKLRVSACTSSQFTAWKSNGDLVELISGKLGIFHSWLICIVDNVTITQTQFVNAWNTGINPLYGITYANASIGDITDFVNVSNTAFPFTAQIKEFAGTSGFLGYEAGKNSLALNPFVGASLLMEECQAAPTDAQRNVLIVNLVYDNRSQILLGHGTFDTTNGFELHFNLWFSRRLTGVSIFNQKIEMSGTGNVNSYVVSTEVYPYYKWKKDFGTSSDIRINEIKHFTQYNLYDFTKGVNGQLAEFISNVSDNTVGQNGYTYTTKTLTYYRGDTSNTLYNHCWFIQFNNTNQALATDGKGIKYIAKCNRYIDQDTTMNYERVSFVGQTNGRFFPIGIKNTIEEEPFESNDIVCYNIYAGAVSEYDTFLRDRFMPVAFGDKDQLRAIENNSGYLFLAKDNNSFALEVNTDNEIKYRTIDTRLGRGISDPRLLVQTPYGLIMPTSDGVWLVTQNGTERILTPDNGKFELYKTLLSTASFKSIIYNKSLNELYLALTVANDSNNYTTYIMFYSFEEQKWGGYYYLNFDNSAGIVGCKPTVFRENTSREIVFFNYDESASSLANFRIDKFSSTSSTFTKPNGTTFPIVWLMKTHYTPYGGRMLDIILQKFTLLYDTAAITNKSLTIKIYKDNIAATSYTLNLNNTASSLKNQIQELIGKFEGVASTMAFSIENDSSNGFDNFTINGIDLWIATQNRRKIN